MTTKQAESGVRRAGRRAQAGFTLIEIMVVVAIIGLIMGAGGFVAFNRFKKAQVSNAKVRVTEISNATMQYMLDNNNTCPGGVDALVAGKYLAKKGVKDPWGKDFIFLCPGQNDTDGADVASAGPDKAEGTQDDIKSWE